jgi:hypothetical protein
VAWPGLKIAPLIGSSAPILSLCFVNIFRVSQIGVRNYNFVESGILKSTLGPTSITVNISLLSVIQREVINRSDHLVHTPVGIYLEVPMHTPLRPRAYTKYVIIHKTIKFCA